MSRGKKPVRSPAAAGGWWRAARPALAVLLTLALVGGVLAALGVLGDEALRRVGGRDRYRTAFADIRCDPPPGLDRADFLSEVRYVSDFPETLNALDPVEKGKLAAAFAAHPWVEAVDEVAVEPSKVVRVRLAFRKPALAVKVATGDVRTVDAHGVLLPDGAVPPGVPTLVNLLPAPTTAAGRVWADDTVARAVELVRAYHPTRVEKLPRGWRLTLADGRLLSVIGDIPR